MAKYILKRLRDEDIDPTHVSCDIDTNVKARQIIPGFKNITYDINISFEAEALGAEINRDTDFWVLKKFIEEVVNDYRGTMSPSSEIPGFEDYSFVNINATGDNIDPYTWKNADTIIFKIGLSCKKV